MFLQHCDVVPIYIIHEIFAKDIHINASSVSNFKLDCTELWIKFCHVNPCVHTGVLEDIAQTFCQSLYTPTH